MKNPGFLLRYFLVLTLFMGLVFALHTGVKYLMRTPAFSDMLPAAYLVNFVLAFCIVAGLYGVRRKARHQIGFLFIGGSLLKFAVFFLFFYPEYNADATLSRAEFLSFFVPYSTALVLETVFASRMLRKLERDEAP